MKINSAQESVKADNWQKGIVGIGGLLVVACFLVMFGDSAAEFFQDSFGIEGMAAKKETLEFLGWIISGIIALYGLTALNKRAEAQDKKNSLTEKGLYQDRLKAAIEHLGNQQSPPRMASFYEFLYLARDVPDYAENILGILSAYLHGISNDAESKVLPAEKQTLVNVLFSAEARDVFGQFNYDLQGVNLVGIKFQKIHKPGREVDFSDADFSGADFTRACLKGFNLQGAVLKGAKLDGADFSEARLLGANFSNANFFNVKLDGAILLGADFSGAILSCVDFSGADLQEANFSGARLLFPNFSGADLRGADLQKAKRLEDAILSGAKYNSETVFPDGFNIPEDMTKEY